MSEVWSEKMRERVQARIVNRLHAKRELETQLRVIEAEIEQCQAFLTTIEDVAA